MNISDDDIAGLWITQSGGNTIVAEGGPADSVTVALKSQPLADVIVTLNLGAQVTTVPMSRLTFTAMTWNVAQTVAVTAVDDAIAEGTHTGAVGFMLTSADPSYNGLAVASVSVTASPKDSSIPSKARVRARSLTRSSRTPPRSER